MNLFTTKTTTTRLGITLDNYKFFKRETSYFIFGILFYKKEDILRIPFSTLSIEEETLNNVKMGVLPGLLKCHSRNYDYTKYKKIIERKKFNKNKKI